MSRRLFAPILLLIAAAGSLAAVFAVQDIEASGGPLAQPFNTPYFSPLLEGNQGLAVVRFTTKQEEVITVRILDRRGRVVRTLIDEERISGAEIRPWDGTDDDGQRLPDGTYRTRITRAGDARVYAPARPMVIDTVAPVARLDQVEWIDGELRGLVLIEPDAALIVEESDGTRISGVRSWPPRPGTVSGRPIGPRPTGSIVVRFTAPAPTPPVSADELHVIAVDRAGNRTDTRDDDTVVLTGPSGS